MSLPDSGGTRADRARAALALTWVEQLHRNAEISFFTFSDSLQTVPLDSLQAVSFNGDGSNLAGALQAT
jgi:hypothetical protein